MGNIAVLSWGCNGMTAADRGVAVELVDAYDTRKLTEEQRSAALAKDARVGVGDAFAKKQRGMRLAKAKGKAKAKAKAAAAKPRLPAHIEQTEARRWIPEGSSTWRALPRGAWCAHVPPRRRISEPWAVHGCEQLALKTMFVRMWAQHLELVGDGPSDCPFDLAAAAESAAAAS